MYKIGLTGGIGSGKSRVADLLAEWGAAIIDTDVIAHDLTAPGGAAIEPISQLFGPDVIAATGALDRQAMRDLVFESPEARQQLEALLHPMIGAVTKQRASLARGCYLVYVVPLLVESGHWRDRVDRICVVDCDIETQFKRVQARSGLTREAITRIINAQVPRETRLAAADDVIINDGTTGADELVRRTRVLHDGWCVQARQGCSPS
ncbi:dephospho-CoA kinase [Pusillimonas sp. ANT_WB101]|uniref:dephospho-CoA kinase n=1 Tax=Pusillimonas sp. ANT_WB101 TaxID=2597356 RepID=UPI0011F043DC|nr:dephospho-CoA kinase [Pusillimonas sp. ANT_WB101]KAA0890671.1 dephospho-CoA kinase [Pusillimonas sp. ANT_WB101]NYT75492.1 dephospho-CoA kinase [Alcaligenaceae bacterium]